MSISQGDYPANKLTAVRNLAAIHGWELRLWQPAEDLARFARLAHPDFTQLECVMGRPSWSLANWWQMYLSTLL